MWIGGASKLAHCNLRCDLRFTMQEPENMASTRQMKVFAVYPICAWTMCRDPDGMARVLDVKRQDYERILYHALVSSFLHTCSSSLCEWRVSNLDGH
jgi:hypothetical protein